MKVKIYYHDTDCGGVVYYANYLKYMEEARTEFFESRGLRLKVLARCGTLFVVARQEIDYKSPAFYADVLEIETRFPRIDSVRLFVEHEVKNQEEKLICEAKTILVCVDNNIKPKAIPEEIRQKLHETLE
jgi:acyl-CoA thioester hydrolase